MNNHPKVGLLYINIEENEKQKRKTIYVYVGLCQPKCGTTLVFRFRPVYGSKLWDCNTMFPERFRLLE